MELRDFEYYIDSSRHKRAEDIASLPSALLTKVRDQQPNLGLVPYPVWVKFRLKIQDTRPYYAKLKNSTDYLNTDLYGFVGNKCVWVRKSGLNVPYSQRPYRYTEVILDLSPEQDVIYWLCFRSDYVLQIGVDLYRDNALLRANHYFDLSQGLYYGIVLVISLYNLALFFSTRERIYIYYALTVVGTSLVMSLLIGQLFEFLSPNNPFLLIDYTFTVIALGSIPSIIFLYRFIDVKRYMPRLYKLKYVLIAGYALCAGLNLLGVPHAIVRSMIDVVIFIALTSSLLMGCYVAIKGYRPALFFSIAWVSYVSGMLIFVLQDINAIDSNNLTFYAAQIGSAIEMVLLAFGVANKISGYKREKNIAQKIAFKAMQEQQAYVQKQNERLEQNISERTQEIESVSSKLSHTAEALESQRGLLAQKNKMLTQGINSAKIIQEAMLPSLHTLQRVLPNSFVLFLPKDIVSGDFYWVKPQGNKIYLAVADCTGHGVHGAFIALIGSKLLDESLSANKSLDRILETLHQSIVAQFRQKETLNNDGMDISLCAIDFNTQSMSFAGARSSIFIVRNGDITEYKGSSKHIGGIRRFSKGSRPFAVKAIPLEPQDYVYLASDGYYHQYSMPSKIKLSKATFKKLLLKNSSLEPVEQQNALNQALKEWAMGAPQIDDVTVLGFRPNI
ncbi:MAG: hypothetical protein EAZ67_10705 [Cytophagales bacterium]|nr:MAG: hypothetical protein EAZ67_10705 [Cytophagales bacterium]